MTKKELKILTNIIGGVESGGQIYGKRNYAAYAGKGANTDNEKTCTLGWAQNYGNKGRKLCKMIFNRNPEVFRAADTANIEAKLKEDWETSKWNPSAKEKAALIAIITTNDGKECQDEMFEELVRTYLKHAENFGVADTKAQMMWCEIEHLGGLNPTKRIFRRANKPFTPESIFESLLLDQKDTSNNNQVGDKKFQSRHECCVKWINQYVTSEKQEKVRSAEDILNVMRGWVGWGRSNGKHKEIIDIYNSDEPNNLPRGWKVRYSDAYCDTTISAAGIVTGMKDLIGKECGVEEHVTIWQKMGIWQEDGKITPKAGWIIVFNWGDETQPNDGYSDHVGIVESVKDGIIVTIEGNYGGEVKRRTIPVSWGFIRGYAIPKYESTKGQEPNVSNNNTGKTETGSTMLSRSPKWVGEVTASSLNVRKWAGTSYKNLDSWPRLNKGNLVDVCDTIYDTSNNPWYFVRIQGNIFGFVDSRYIARK